jgi:hypothetical protein
MSNKGRNRNSNFLDNRLIDRGESVSLTCRPPFTPKKIPGTYFCYESTLWPVETKYEI